MRITRDEYNHLLDMAGATWHRNAVRWARHLVDHQAEARTEVANQVVAENDGAWSDLTEADRFTLVNRVVSRFQQRWARDHERYWYADEALYDEGEAAGWDRVATDGDPADAIDYEPMTEEDLVAFFVEHGIEYSPAANTVEKLLAWANAPAGMSKAAVSRSLGLQDNTIATALFEVKRWGLKEKVTA